MLFCKKKKKNKDRDNRGSYILSKLNIRKYILKILLNYLYLVLLLGIIKIPSVETPRNAIKHRIVQISQLLQQLDKNMSPGVRGPHPAMHQTCDIKQVCLCFLSYKKMKIVGSTQGLNDKQKLPIVTLAIINSILPWLSAIQNQEV